MGVSGPEIYVVWNRRSFIRFMIRFTAWCLFMRVLHAGGSVQALLCGWKFRNADAFPLPFSLSEGR